MLVNKRNLSVVEAASKAESRYSLAAVMLEADGSTVATDGTILARVSPAKAEAGSFQVNGSGNLAGYTGKLLLPVQFAKDAAAAIPKKTFAPILENVAIGAVAEDGLIKKLVAQADLPPRTIEAAPERGNFPNYECTIPRECAEPQAEFCFDSKLLMRLLKIAGKFGNGIVRLRVYGPDKAVRLDAVDDSGQEFTGVVMPVMAEIAPKYRNGGSA